MKQLPTELREKASKWLKAPDSAMGQYLVYELLTHITELGMLEPSGFPEGWPFDCVNAGHFCAESDGLAKATGKPIACMECGGKHEPEDVEDVTVLSFVCFVCKESFPKSETEEVPTQGGCKYRCKGCSPSRPSGVSEKLRLEIEAITKHAGAWRFKEHVPMLQELLDIALDKPDYGNVLLKEKDKEIECLEQRLKEMEEALTTAPVSGVSEELKKKIDDLLLSAKYELAIDKKDIEEPVKELLGIALSAPQWVRGSPIEDASYAYAISGEIVYLGKLIPSNSYTHHFRIPDPPKLAKPEPVVDCCTNGKDSIKVNPDQTLKQGWGMFRRPNDEASFIYIKGCPWCLKPLPELEK